MDQKASGTDVGGAKGPVINASDCKMSAALILNIKRVYGPWLRPPALHILTATDSDAIKDMEAVVIWTEAIEFQTALPPPEVIMFKIVRSAVTRWRLLIHFDVSIYPLDISKKYPSPGYRFRLFSQNDLLTFATIFNGHQHPVLLCIIPTSANFFTFQRYIQSNIVVEHCWCTTSSLPHPAIKCCCWESIFSAYFHSKSCWR